MSEVRKRGKAAAAQIPASPPVALPQTPAKPPPTALEKGLILAIFAALLLPSLYCYNRYGSNFFIPYELTRLTHSGEEWQAMLRTRTVALIGGPHRGGTSVLWESLAAHPLVSAFGDSFATGADHSEGMFVQTVYPRFGIGSEFNRGHAGGKAQQSWRPVGLGRYALGTEAAVHWTETHARVTPRHQALLLNEFGRFWNLTEGPGAPTVLLEKSPPNAVLARFLQALLNQGNGDWAPTPPHFGGAPRSVVRFVFITRHPVANMHAHRALSACAREQPRSLLLNYLKIHEYLEADEPSLQAARRLTLESLAAEPQAHIEALWAWLGLPPAPEAAARAAARIRPDPNKRYRDGHCAALAADPAFGADFAKAATDLNGRVEALARVGSDSGERYSLRDPAWACA
jgi:hypothetical protein